MKLTSFTIFFILLIVLLISVVFAYVLPEGFISYNSNGGSLSQLKVPPYSSTNMIYKVFDSVYFDPDTGNVIELFGIPGGSNGTDSTVNSLTNIIVMPEMGGSVNQYDKTGTSAFSENMIEPSLVGASITNSLNSWVYPGANTVNTLSFNYQVLYFPWNKDIVIVIYDILSKKFQGVYTFLSGGSTTSEYNIPASVTIPTTNIPDTNSSNNSFTDSAKTLYQISQHVSFSTSQKQLIINNTNVNVNSTTAVSDPTGGNIVLAIPFSNNRTMVCVICPDSANTQLMTIRNVDRFDPSLPGGVVSGGTITSTTTPSITPSTCTTTPTTTPPSCKSQVDMNNYLLKTQVVPPVCPACASCPNVNNNISCPGCGNTRSSGNDISNNTLSSIIANAYAQSLQSQFYAQSLQSQLYGGGNSLGGVSNNLIDKITGVGNNLIDKTTGLGNTALNNATGLVAGAELGAVALGGGAELLAGQTINKAGDIVTGTVGTMGDVSKTAIGGTVDLSKALASDVVKPAIGGTVDLSKALAGDVTTLGTGAENVAGKVVTGATDLGGKAITGATDLGGKAITGATDLGGKAITGATALGVGAEMGATSLGMGAMGTVNNAVNTVGKIGSGPVGQNSRGTAGNYQGDTQGNRGYMSSNAQSSGTGFITSGTPGYNEYYGAVAQKPTTNFIPVTSDFSKFGR